MIRSVGGGGGKAAVRTRLRIDNACCEAEATLAKKTLHAIAGVDKVSVNVVGRIAYATHRPHLVGAQALADALNEHNLGASVAAAPEAAAAWRGVNSGASGASSESES